MAKRGPSPPEDSGGIMEITIIPGDSLSRPYRGYGCLGFPSILATPDAVGNGSRNRVSLAAIRVRK